MIGSAPRGRCLPFLPRSCPASHCSPHRRPPLPAPGRSRAGRFLTDGELRGAPRAAERPAPRPDARRDLRLRRALAAGRHVLERCCAGRRRGDPAVLLRRHRPGRLSPGQLGALRPAVRRGAQARHRPDPRDHLGPGAALGDRAQEGPPQQPERRRLQGLRHRGRPPLRRPDLDVVGLERAQPAPVPAAPVLARPAGVAEDLPRPLHRRGRRPAQLGQRERHDPARRDLAARHEPRGRAAHVPARGALPVGELPPLAEVRVAAGRRLRAPRLHHGAPVPPSARSGRTTSRSACSRA